MDACSKFDGDADVKSIIITGAGNKAFAAGADIKEMQHQSYNEISGKEFFSGWDGMRRIRKPLIAAVNGLALGGGCELAMMCDIIIAADTAMFGQVNFLKVGALDFYSLRLAMNEVPAGGAFIHCPTHMLAQIKQVIAFYAFCCIHI